LRDRTAEATRAEELGRADRELAALHAQLLRRQHHQSVGELAASAALALNNELNAMALTLPLLRAAIDGASTPAATERHLEALAAGLQRSATLVAHLQELATPRAPGSPRPLDLNEIVMQALDLVRPELTAAAAGRSVRVDARLGDVPPVLAHGAELREVICALLVEARDRLPTDGLLSLTTRREGDRAVLLLSHATRPRPTDDATASGLVLAAAQDLVRRWSGELLVDGAGASGAGRATVRLALPLAIAPVLAPAAAGRSRLSRARDQRRVLIVDDDPGNREALGELLALSGHSVDAAASSAEALALVERARYDAALVDLAMPDMNGWELARRLRARAPELRIAIVTGWEPSDIAPAGGSVDALFRKPIDLPAIQSFLEGAVPSADASR
jgi:CheY-like chemotaxis protein